jgi:hypothetical protein
MDRGPHRTVGLVMAVVLAVGAGCGAERDQQVPGHVPDPALAGDWMAMYEDYLASQAESLRARGLEVPTDAEFVRFLELGEFPSVYAECLREQGFDAELSPDGGGLIQDSVPPDQHSAHLRAFYRCQVRYPVHPRFSLPLTDGQVRVLYDYFVESLVGCLEDEGYEVSPAPSFETFLAEWRSPHHAWEPYDSVQIFDQRRSLEVYERCPQRPPVVDLYGEPDG